MLIIPGNNVWEKMNINRYFENKGVGHHPTPQFILFNLCINAENKFLT